jgi:hypothetical protein
LGYLAGHVYNLQTTAVDGQLQFGTYSGVGVDPRANLVK